MYTSGFYRVEKIDVAIKSPIHKLTEQMKIVELLNNVCRTQHHLLKMVGIFL